MKNQAFTLIELLVVVLIIGILAAIAVPQYQVAVEKARVAKVIPMVEHLVKEMQLYYLANNAWPTQYDDMGISSSSVVGCYIDWGGRLVAGGGSHNQFYRVKLNADGSIDRRYCYADKSNDFENKLCKSLTGKKTYQFTNGGDLLGYTYP